MNEPFYGPHLKIERAKKHINDLHTEIVNFSLSDYYRVSIDKHPDTGNDALKFQVVKSFPTDEVALITGDAIHNLRSALDIAINDIVLAETGTRSKHAKFPVRDTRNGLITAINGGDIKQAPKQILDLILDVIQPYRAGGKEAICALHDLDIEDKHRLILPTVHFGLSPIARFEQKDGTLVPTFGEFSVEAGNLYFWPIGSSSDFDIANNRKPILLVFLPKGLIKQGQLLVPSLHQLTEVVSDIIEQFGRLCLK